jgi:L-methionine (R)-S-oxide reductase
MTLETHGQFFKRRRIRSVVDSLMGKLNALLSFPESQGNLSEILHRLEDLAAGFFDAVNCSVVLFAEEELEKSRFHASPGFGKPTSEVCGRPSEKRAGVLGAATVTGELLLTEREKSRYIEDASKRSMFCPIVSRGKTIGLIHVGEPKNKRYFNPRDLKLLEVVALVIAKLVQVIQLQNILNSRFAQIALAQSVNSATVDPSMIPVHHQNRIAKIVAKSFYREMKKAGLGPNQIIITASEILSELSESLRELHGSPKGSVRDYGSSAESGGRFGFS